MLPYIDSEILSIKTLEVLQGTTLVKKKAHTKKPLPKKPKNTHHQTKKKIPFPTKKTQKKKMKNKIKS